CGAPGEVALHRPRVGAAHVQRAFAFGDMERHRVAQRPALEERFDLVVATVLPRKNSKREVYLRLGNQARAPALRHSSRRHDHPVPTCFTERSRMSPICKPSRAKYQKPMTVMGTNVSRW